ncbi:hypothetical protein [Velocimicrobium porci]|uniref:Uncharacterized protein n=1 Tax=Velocimicrobium porci TaxID=2606634 RepID=A0A6L5XYS1_9FIRM|nr:hypothetical protein [Velocimicrobium porci]MSS63093.1 hypothetical protein [Velocimicrobium porci]
MKLKYKKMVLLVTMSTMFIGLVVFSIVSPSKKTSTEVEKKVEATENTEKKAEETTATPKPTEEPEEPVLTKTANKKIIKLVKSYYSGGMKCDMDLLKEIHSNPDLINKKEIKAKYRYVDDVKNIECYTVKGLEKGSYLVYIYSEYKFKDIKTLAPGLSRLYLQKTDDGQFQIFNGADAKISEFILETDKEEEVQNLVDKVSTKLEEALSIDADLKKFNEEVLNNGTKASNSDKDTQETKEEKTSNDKKSE